MSWGWTLLGMFGQLLLAYLLFMLVAFSGGGMASGRSLRPRQLRVLNLSIFVLPGACLCSALIVLGLQVCGGGAGAYAWHALPLVATVLYLGYLRWLVRHG
jgi:hypothetical protein